MTEPAAAPERADHVNRTIFIASLLKLAKPSDAEGRDKGRKDMDRGALAALRRSLQDPNGMAASACPFVQPYLSKGDDGFVERMHFLVGALFALHPEHADGFSLGRVFRHINSDTAEGRQGKDNPSTRARFVALLDAHAEDIDVHVRHAISLARAKSCPVDWHGLLRDLIYWRDPERRVQSRLARDFWRPIPDAPSPQPTPETVSESEAPR